MLASGLGKAKSSAQSISRVMRSLGVSVDAAGARELLLDSGTYLT